MTLLRKGLGCEGLGDMGDSGNFVADANDEERSGMPYRVSNMCACCTALMPVVCKVGARQPIGPGPFPSAGGRRSSTRPPAARKRSCSCPDRTSWMAHAGRKTVFGQRLSMAVAGIDGMAMGRCGVLSG